MNFCLKSCVWQHINKGYKPARAMADRHYTRQTHRALMWTRPGFNFCLFASYPKGSALFCWWRPKWEDGRPGTERKDKLKVIECVMFRREGVTDLASLLIREAVEALDTIEAAYDLHLDTAGRVDHLITGISSEKTNKGRSRKSRPGQCFRHAGWTDFNKKTKRADTWLQYPWQNRREVK